MAETNPDRALSVPRKYCAEGFSIRFAEEAARAMGNIDIETVTLWDDDSKRILGLTVLDLENNIVFTNSITVNKTVEKRFLKSGEQALSVRVNSKGEPTYLMPASDDEVIQKQQSLSSKSIRNGILRLRSVPFSDPSCFVC